MAPNTHRGLFSICHFVFTYKHNLKTKAHKWTFYLSNNCSTNENVYFLGWSCMWGTIVKLRIQTCYATSFRYNILLVIILVTKELQVINGCSTIQMTALLWEMSIFCVRAGCEILLASYGSKHVFQSLSSTPFVRTITHITWKLLVMYKLSAHWMTALLSDTFFVWFKVA